MKKRKKIKNKEKLNLANYNCINKNNEEKLNK
jgi:hypothetical protein